jgi:tripartite-type tricarboxylate transporter receptor subunit TctC
MTRRAFIAVLGGVGTLILSLVAVTGATKVHAEPYPSKPIQLFVSYAPGSQPDILARGLGDGLAFDLAQPIIVVNREGASGTLGFIATANSAPDGYTLAFGPQGALTIQPNLKRNLGYQLETFVPVCQVAEDRFVVVVGQQSPIKDFNDLVERARAKPKSLTYGSPGLGTIPSLMIEGIAQARGFTIVHAPYRNSGQMLQDILSGTLDFGVVTGAGARGLNLRVLVNLGRERNPVFPDAPTAGELGYTCANPGFVGLYAVRGTPKDVVNRLEQSCSKAFTSQSYQIAVTNAAASPVFLPSDAFRSRLADDNQEKQSLIKALGIKIE